MDENVIVKDFVTGATAGMFFLFANEPSCF